MSRIKLVTELNNYVCCSCIIIIHYSLRYCYSSTHKVISTVSKIKPLKIWIGLTGQPNCHATNKNQQCWMERDSKEQGKIHVHPLHRRWLMVKPTLAFMPAVFTSSIRSEGPRSCDTPCLLKRGIIIWMVLTITLLTDVPMSWMRSYSLSLSISYL